MEEHQAHLDEVCRVGGKKFTSLTQKTRYHVCEFQSELQSTFKIDISKDDPEVHPNTFVYFVNAPWFVQEKRQHIVVVAAGLYLTGHPTNV